MQGIANEQKLKALYDLYDARNITAEDLYSVLEEVLFSSLRTSDFYVRTIITKQTAPSCSNDMIMDCNWKGQRHEQEESLPCTNYFSVLPTDGRLYVIDNQFIKYVI